MSEQSKEFLSKEEVQTLVKKLALEVSSIYALAARNRVEEPKIVVIGLLNGCYQFLSDFSKNMVAPHQVEAIKASSYKNNKKSTEVVKFSGLPRTLKGKDVLILDTIIDSGSTMKELYIKLEKLNPRSVLSASLLLRSTSSFTPNFYSLLIEDTKFFVGYGLDDKGDGRHLQKIITV